MSHYLYFPAQSDARRAAADLAPRGFRIEQRMGADGVNWLVLASHDIAPSEASIASARRVMEDAVNDGVGEYDGWEATPVTH